MKHNLAAAMGLVFVLATAWIAAQAQDAPHAPASADARAQAAPGWSMDSKVRRQGPNPSKDMSQAKARQMLEQVMIAKLSSELKLTDEQSVLLMRRFAEVRDEKQALGKERAEVLRNLRGIVEEHKDEAALKDNLARLQDIDTKMASYRQRLRDAMGADLDPWQKAKLVLFLDQFESDIKQMLREVQERRSMRPAGPMGMPPGPGMMPPGMQPGMQPHPGMPGMNPQGMGRGPMQHGPNGPEGMRPPQGQFPQGPPPQGQFQQGSPPQGPVPPPPPPGQPGQGPASAPQPTK